MVADNGSRNRSCPMFSRPDVALPWRVRNLGAGQPSLNVRRVDPPSCSLTLAMLSSTKRKKNDGNAKALGDPHLKHGNGCGNMAYTLSCGFSLVTCIIY